MKLGGNNAHIVTDDADIDAAVDTAVFGSFVHQGWSDTSSIRMSTTSTSRNLPNGQKGSRSVAPTIRAVGPIIGESQCDQMIQYVEETIDARATLETGSETIDLDGVDDSLVVAPTVLSDVANDMTAACNEHFGPIAPIISFSGIDEAIELAKRPSTVFPDRFTPAMWA